MGDRVAVDVDVEEMNDAEVQRLVEETRPQEAGDA